jgi:hypothetical protein
MGRPAWPQLRFTDGTIALVKAVKDVGSLENRTPSN